MSESNKHKIVSKEELFSLIDEKKSLSPESDDFDKEAMEGLAMLTNRHKVDGLNNSIDEVLLHEAKRAKKRRNIYFLSAAASLALIISFFFLLKDNSIDKKEKVLAENTGTVNNIPKYDEPKIAEENPVTEKKLADATANAPTSTTLNTGVTTATGETNGKEEKKGELKISSKSNQGISAGDVMAVPPTEVAANAQTKTENRKAANEELEADRDYERSKGGKDYKVSLEKDDQLKREETKKTDGKLADKEKDKTRYVTNTVWTSTPGSGAGIAADESKNKTSADKNQNQLDQDANNIITNSNNASGAPQKNAEVAVYEKQTSKEPEKKAKSSKEQTIKPDTTVTDMLAGYSYYGQNQGKGIVQGGEPQKTQQPSAPAQTENAVTSSSTITQKEVVDIAGEQKYNQEAADKKPGKHESQPDNALAQIQNATPKSAVRSNTALESAEFIGGNAALQQYVKKNLKISAPKYSGTIVAEFVVNKDGKIDTSTVKVTAKIKNCDPCGNDVTELVKTMPKWKPATESGKAAKSKQTLSVKYNAVQAGK